MVSSSGVPSMSWWEPITAMPCRRAESMTEATTPSSRAVSMSTRSTADCVPARRPEISVSSSAPRARVAVGALSALCGGAEGDQQRPVGAERGTQRGERGEGHVPVVLGVLEVRPEPVQAPFDDAGRGRGRGLGLGEQRVEVVADQGHDDLGPAPAELDTAHGRGASPHVHDAGLVGHGAPPRSGAVSPR